MRLGVRWPCGLPQRRKEDVESLAAIGRGQPVPGCEQVGRRGPKGISLVVVDLQCEPGVEIRVVDASTPELSVLVVF